MNWMKNKSNHVQTLLYIYSYSCHKLVYYEEYSNVEMAIAREKQLKGWSRAKKDSLIDSKNKEREDLMPW